MNLSLNRKMFLISIQALYDYKSDILCWPATSSVFQFKHCTIIRNKDLILEYVIDISIQALYDYKKVQFLTPGLVIFISIQALYDYKV